MNLIALAIAPGLAICLFVFYKDNYNREPKRNLVVSFILGSATIIPAFYIETFFGSKLNGTVSQLAIYSYCVVAFIEELGKFIVIRYYAFPKKSFDEPLDGIVYAVMIGMGFATVENIGYVMQHGIAVAFLRMFLSVPAHATFAVIMGYHVGKAKFATTNKSYFLFLGLFWAIVFHGTFDYFLFLQNNALVNQYVSNILLFGGALISLIVGLWLSRRHFHQYRLSSKQAFENNNRV
ncbi:MAG TPA: PrsW family glutamic-type intramembrane protease [Chitinophagaceae bacterium]|nr:PrsW family glutamic-type intramembrane protease [Chitinophagaceae bacterium]